MNVLPKESWNHLSGNYGGKRAFLAAVWYASRASLGAYRRFRQVHWSKVSRVVFVCKGNICRSPYAEHRFRAWGANSASAGLQASPGNPAAPAAQQAALRRGVDLAAHRSTAISESVIAAGDLLVAFEPAHAKALRVLASGRVDVQVTLLPLWSSSPRLVYLHDPYGLPGKYFDRCFERIDSGLGGILARVPTQT